MMELPDEEQWTDFSPSDPGITTARVFAYLAEAVLGLVLVAAWWRHSRRARGTTGG